MLYRMSEGFSCWIVLVWGALLSEELNVQGDWFRGAVPRKAHVVATKLTNNSCMAVRMADTYTKSTALYFMRIFYLIFEQRDKARF